MIDYFEYDIRKPEELIRELNLNIEKRLSLLYEKSYAVNCYKNNLNIFCSLPEKTILKFIKLGDFDIKEINCLRKKWGYNQILL